MPESYLDHPSFSFSFLFHYFSITLVYLSTLSSCNNTQYLDNFLTLPYDINTHILYHNTFTFQTKYSASSYTCIPFSTLYHFLHQSLCMSYMLSLHSIHSDFLNYSLKKILLSTIQSSTWSYVLHYLIPNSHSIPHTYPNALQPVFYLPHLKGKGVRRCSSDSGWASRLYLESGQLNRVWWYLEGRGRRYGHLTLVPGVSCFARDLPDDHVLGCVDIIDDNA